MDIKRSLLPIVLTQVFFAQGMAEYVIAQYHKEILQLIDKKPDLSYLTSDSPLLEIVKHKELNNLVEFMLKCKANPNVKDNVLSSNTPLCNAARCNNAQAALSLIQAGANISSKNDLDNTPLHIAVRYNSYEVIDVLLQSGAPIHEKNSCGDTPLHTALEQDIFSSGLWKNRKKIVELLLQYGADPLAQNNKKDDAFKIIAEEYQRALEQTHLWQSSAFCSEMIYQYQTEAQEYQEIARLLNHANLNHANNEKPLLP